MKIGRFCRKNAVIVTKGITVLNAAKLLRDCGAKSAIIVADDNRAQALGIADLETLAYDVIAEEKDPAQTRLSEVMINRFVTVKESDSLFDTIRMMFDRGMERVVIVGDKGHLNGLVTLEALFGELMMELLELSTLVESAAKAAGRERSDPLRRTLAAMRDASGTSRQMPSTGRERAPLVSHP